MNRNTLSPPVPEALMLVRRQPFDAVLDINGHHLIQGANDYVPSPCAPLKKLLQQNEEQRFDSCSLQFAPEAALAR